MRGKTTRITVHAASEAALTVLYDRQSRELLRTLRMEGEGLRPLQTLLWLLYLCSIPGRRRNRSFYPFSQSRLSD